MVVYFLGTPLVGEKQQMEKKKERKKESMCEQQPATLANATTCGTHKPPGPIFEILLELSINVQHFQKLVQIYRNNFLMVDKSTDYKESCSVPRKLSEQFSTRALIDCAAANLINKLSTGLWKF